MAVRKKSRFGASDDKKRAKKIPTRLGLRGITDKLQNRSRHI
jgi:hypothetical protein